MKGRNRFAVWMPGFWRRRALEATRCSVRRAPGRHKGRGVLERSSGREGASPLRRSSARPGLPERVVSRRRGAESPLREEMTPDPSTRHRRGAGSSVSPACSGERAFSRDGKGSRRGPHVRRSSFGSSGVRGPPNRLEEPAMAGLPGRSGVASRRCLGSQEEPSPRRGDATRRQLAARARKSQLDRTVVPRRPAAAAPRGLRRRASGERRNVVRVSPRDERGRAQRERTPWRAENPMSVSGTKQGRRAR